MHPLAGRLIAIEGIDQAGKQTVCRRLVDALRDADVCAELFGFPDYSTPLGGEIGRFLASGQSYPAQTRQLLFAANRWERAGDMRTCLDRGCAVIVDRYIGSGIAYGMAQGLDREWTSCVEQGLPEPDLTILLDIDPSVSLSRKTVGRDAYESRVELLTRARRAYRALSENPSWQTVDGSGDQESVWSAVEAKVRAFANRADGEYPADRVFSPRARAGT